MSGLCQPVADEQLKSVLTEVGLEAAVTREGGLDAERDWAQVLSPGDLQALTFVRLLLASPRFAFLDDPTKVIEPPLAERLYQALAHSSIAYVTTSCPASLLSRHDMQLELHEDGTWQLGPAGANGQPEDAV